MPDNIAEKKTRKLKKVNQQSAREIPHDPMAVPPYLPEHLIFQILLRLPVKSLLRFKCVSKTYCSWISCSKFIKTHLKISSKDKKLNHHRVLLLPHPNSNATALTYSLHVTPNGTSNRVEFDFPFQHQNGKVSYVDSINGLVCLQLECARTNRLILWNPSTRKFIRAWPIPVSESITSCGFAYDESSDDYKLVVFKGYNYFFDGVYKIFSTVYSLKKDSSQNLFSQYSSGRLCREKALYSSGFLHCLAKKSNDQRPTNYIASFDPVAGTFDSIPMPNFGSSNPSPNFTKLGEWLALVYDHITRVDVYIIKDYAEKQWTKLISIPIYDFTCPTKPVFLFENGMILCRCLRRVDLYNGTEFLVQNFEPYWEQDLATYVESLTPPGNGADVASSS